MRVASWCPPTQCPVLVAAQHMLSPSPAPLPACCCHHGATLPPPRLFEAELRRQQEELRAQRMSQVGTGDRSEKIKTYNYKDSRVSDHRLKQNYDLNRQLDGELEDNIQARAAQSPCPLGTRHCSPVHHPPPGPSPCLLAVPLCLAHAAVLPPPILLLPAGHDQPGPAGAAQGAGRQHGGHGMRRTAIASSSESVLRVMLPNSSTNCTAPQQIPLSAPPPLLAAAARLTPACPVCSSPPQTGCRRRAPPPQPSHTC